MSDLILKKYAEIERKIEPIKSLLEQKKDNPLYKKFYKGIITLQSPVIIEPEILFIGINPGPGAYNQKNWNGTNETPLRMLGGDESHFKELSWYEKGNARIHHDKSNDKWTHYEWYERNMPVNNTFTKNMINLLYETARLKYPDKYEKSQYNNQERPFWHEEFGQKIMATNLYPIATTNIADLKKIHKQLAEEDVLRPIWERFKGNDKVINEWTVRKFFISLTDELITLVKPKLVVCMGLSSLNDYTFSSHKEEIVVQIKKIKDHEVTVIGFSRKGQWSSKIEKIAKTLIINTK